MDSSEHSIVIVEDEGLIAADLQGRLERPGYRVPGVAGTAHETLDVIGGGRPGADLLGQSCGGGILRLQSGGCSGQAILRIVADRASERRKGGRSSAAGYAGGDVHCVPHGLWLEGAQGRRYAIEGSLAPRWRNGRVDGVVVTFKDVTLRRFDEEQTRAGRGCGAGF